MFVGVLHKPAIILNRLSNPLFAFDLGIHELGHLLFSPFGDFMRISGGSLFQCLFPLFWLIACLQKGWYFAASLCWCWLGLNLFDVAVYAADARTRILPLMLGPASLGVNPANTEGAYKRGHDWYQILSRTHHLNSDLAIAHGLKIAATISFLLGLIFAGILLSQMIASSLQRLLKKITLAKNKAIQ